MLTYQLQNRIYKKHDNKPFNFPNNIEIQIIFEPLEPFGAAAGFCKTVVKGHKANYIYDANTGRGMIRSKPPLEPINIVLEYDNMRFELQSNKAIVKTRCNTEQELNNLLTSLHYGLPILLNVEIADSPIVKHTCGKVGETSFNWEMMERKSSFETTTQEIQEKRIISSFERMSLFAGSTNRRLLAALHYFHMACRLAAAGHSPWEFMAESVLNLCKMLQILFGQKREEVRTGLKQLGYTTDIIESNFIPIMILRDAFDVGHVTIELLKLDQLEVLYDYLEDIESKFRELLRCILDKVKDGTYEVRKEDDLLPSQDKKRKTQRLITTIGSRSNLRKS